MSGIINALFGHNKDKDEKKHSDKKHSSHTDTTTVSSSSGSSVAHTAISEDVRVQSIVSTENKTNVTMENSKKIADLMSKLGKNSWSRREINEKLAIFGF